MRMFIAPLAALALSSMTSLACPEGVGCCAEAEATTVAATSECAAAASECVESTKAAYIARAKAAGVPMMKFVVGDQKTYCPLEAQQLMASSDAKPVFVLNGKKYTDYVEAGKTWKKALDGYLAELTHVSYAVGDECTSCPETAKAMASKAGKPVEFRLAKLAYTCPDQAGAMAKVASKAAKTVHVSYAVGDETCECPDEASKIAKKSGKSVRYVVAGNTVDCALMAGCMESMVKIQTALAAIEAASTEMASTEG